MPDWTNREIRLLEQMRLDGATIYEIAPAVNRGPRAVESKLHREGIRWLGRDMARRQRWLAAFSGTYTLAGVARLMGVTVSAVKKQRMRLRLAGIEVRAAMRESG